MNQPKSRLFYTQLNSKHIFTLLILALSIAACTPIDLPRIDWAIWQESPAKDRGTSTGAYYSGQYPNAFVEQLGKSEAEVEERLNQIWQQIFYGDDETERVYYPVGPDMAYILDTGHNDVRTEGISYGMMIAVQMDKQAEFNRLWTWAKTHMQHQQGPRRGYFAWHVSPTGQLLDLNPASDGEAWFVMALFFAAARWGNGTGIYHYQTEAQALLNTMLHKNQEPDQTGTITNLFDPVEKQIVFMPVQPTHRFTAPSYHTPHYYELWGRWASQDNQFWCEAALASRQFWQKAAHPTTGLMPDVAQFDGTPLDPFGQGQADFRFDAWRIAMNIAVDHLWFQPDPWLTTQSTTYLDFFQAEGLGRYGNQYTLDGTRLSGDHSPGLVALNAVASLASTRDAHQAFLAALWDTPIPTGEWRYYDGLLYMLAFLQVSGNFKIHNLNAVAPGCGMPN